MHIWKYRLEDGTFGTIVVHGNHLFQTSAVLQTDGVQQTPSPALKGGVTANVAFQAGCVFQTRKYKI